MWSDGLGATGSWQGPIQFPPTPSGGHPSGLVPRVGPNGELYVIASDQPGTGYGIWLYTWIPQVGQAPVPQLTSPAKVATRLDTWDNGSTGDRIPRAFQRAPAWAYLAVDPTDGSLCVVYFDTWKAQCSPCQYDVDVFFTRSVSQGIPGTWTTPKVINIPDSVPYDQFFPWIEITSNHRIDIVFYDTLGATHTDQDYSVGLRTRYAWSADAGQTWNETTIAPLWTGAPATWLAGQASGSGSFIGDYNGMATTNSRVYPVYMATYGPQQPQPPTPNQNIYSNVITWP